MIAKSNQEYIEERCEILESYGLTIAHEDICVELTLHSFSGSSPELKFDLSATGKEFLVIELIRQAYKQGLKAGNDNLAREINRLIKVD